jgi:hypothetical protein
LNRITKENEASRISRRAIIASSHSTRLLLKLPIVRTRSWRALAEDLVGDVLVLSRA